MTEQGKLNDKGGLSDLMVKVMELDEAGCDAVFAVFVVIACASADEEDASVDEAVSIESGSGGLTTGTWLRNSN